MNDPLSFWWLTLLLVGALIVGRVLAGLIWRFLRWVTPQTGRIATRSAQRLPGRQRLANAVSARFPRTSAWVAARFAIDRFTGLPLTLMVLLAGYLVSLGTDLAEDVIEGDQIVKMDHRINIALAPWRNADLLHVFAKITHLADIMTLLAVVLVATAFLWAHRRFRYIPGLMMAVIGSEALTYTAKYAVDRARPDFLTFASAATPSFPSGHATGALAIYGFIAYAIARDLRSTAVRFELAYWSVVLIVLIAFSRLLLSVHFFSDVIAGLLVGGFWLLAGFALTEYLNERSARP
ncbi:phosphatase PAP2 family protein [Salinisphaera sp.]|uniref:phosphatase PAP2 family protein n=1 Tax=Salinisphaera sp. TaxID=1914330 RepID=UPI002D76BF37|nr:phosphatase PAP2 family protein [Salinisphaera sp.]HET7313485.1 phosphatase PAP2 family protein [Salinisphaera sp.]